jgi:hypothetical protein
LNKILKKNAAAQVSNKYLIFEASLGQNSSVAYANRNYLKNFKLRLIMDVEEDN